VGPTDVALLGVIYLVVAGGKTVLRIGRRRAG
jgi:hypothetical protein